MGTLIVKISKISLFILLFSGTLINSMNQNLEEKKIKEENLISKIPYEIIQEIIVEFLSIDKSTPETICESINNVITLRGISKHFRDCLSPQEIIRLIKKYKIDINSTDALKNTALHFAAQKNYIQVAKLLLDNGANVNALAHEDAHGTLIEHIKINGHPKIPYDTEKLSQLHNLLAPHLQQMLLRNRFIPLQSRIRVYEITPFMNACFNNNFKLALLLIGFNSSTQLKMVSIQLPIRTIFAEQGFQITCISLSRLLPDDLVEKINKLES